MASNHVQPPHETANDVFAGHDEMNGYSSLFSHTQPHGYAADNWNLDPDLHLAIPRSNSTPASQSWHSTPTPQPHHASFALNSNIYGQHFSNSAAPYQDQSFGAHGRLQYRPTSFDPPLASDPRVVTANYNPALPNYSTAPVQSGTIAPQVLQTNNSSFGNGDRVLPAKKVSRSASSRRTSGSRPVASGPAAAARAAAVIPAPKGAANGIFLTVELEDLCQTTRTKRLHNFVNISDYFVGFPPNIKTTVPVYNRRRSRSELKASIAGSKKLLGKIVKRPIKKPRIYVPKTVGRKPTSPGPRSFVDIKDELAESSSETESSYDNSDYDSSDDELEITEPSPLPPTRPPEPLKAVRYDTIKAVWLPRQRPAEADKIRNALKDFWEVVRTIRDRWKTDGEAVKKAEEAKKLNELPLLRERVKSQREMLEVALQTANEFGHPDILRLFGENQSFLFLLYQFMLDRIKENDLNGVLSRATLELLSRCSTLTDESVEKTNIGKVLTRCAKRGDERTKALAKQAIDNAAAYTKKKAKSATKEPIGGNEVKETNVKPEPVRRPVPEATAGVKRPRTSEGNVGQPPKRVSSGNPLTAAPSAATKGSTIMQKRATPITAEKAPTPTSITATAASKVKSHQVPTKPSGFFSSLQSASRKPGTSNVVTAAAKQKVPAGALAEKKSVASAAPVATAKPAFSFAETMANLTKPKEPERASVKPEEQRPPETEEEKAKRLRKEQRRKLRVTWKPEASLVSVRLFTHDPDEELGHDASMVRDAGDVGGEGRMFKQHKDMMDVDDEEDYQPEEKLLEFTTPSLIDFSSVDKEERERNYAPYGGGLKQPDSPERHVQERHEANTLMVYYTNRSDIPPTPREPADPYNGQPTTTLDFGTPPDLVLTRAAQFQSTQLTQPQAAVATSGPADISTILSILTTQPTTTQQSAPAPMPAPTPTLQLEDIFAKFSNPSQPPVSQPRMTAAPMQPLPQSQAPDLSSILAALGTHGQAAQAPAPHTQPQPQPQLPQQFPPAMFPPAPPINADLSAMLAAMGNGGMPPAPNFQYPYQQNAGQYPHEDPDRKRYREGEHEERDGDQNKRQKWGGKKGKGPGGRPQYVVQCRFWKDGACKKGDECTFLHE